MRLVFGTCGRRDPWQPGPSRKSPRVAGIGVQGCGTWQAALLAFPWSADPPTVLFIFCHPRPACGPWLLLRVQPVDLGCLSILSLSSLHLRHSSLPTHWCRFLPPSSRSLNFCFHSTGIPLIPESLRWIWTSLHCSSPPPPLSCHLFGNWGLLSLALQTSLPDIPESSHHTRMCSPPLPPPPLGLGSARGGFKLKSQGFYSILLTALLSLFFFA